MKYETYVKRRDKAEILSKAMVKQAQERSVVSIGSKDYAFMTGYLESVITTLAAESPAAMKRLADMLTYKG